LGSGGREHAFAWKIAQSPRLANLYISPGNAGTRECGINVDINPTNFASIKQFVLSNNINLVVVGPEEPLVKGIADFFAGDPEIRLIPVIGPSKEGAKLEGSKDYAKAFMARHGVPTAAYQTFTKGNMADAHAFLETLRPPYVLKADGLAAGKGVLIIDDLQEAKEELARMLDGKFGAASRQVVIEEYLSGIECSVFVATDGKNYKILPEAKDYKRIGEGDTGLNTGGMGAVSPVPFCDAVFMEKVRTRIVEPTVAGLASENIPYHGFIFIGLMNVGGEPMVIEYNVRMGDPETEAVLPRLSSDILDLFEGMAYGTLGQKEIGVTPATAVTVVAVSGGYPGDYEKGKVISGLDGKTDSLVFHAGTAVKGKNTATAGGRVLAVTSLGASIDEAARKSFDTLAGIDYEGIYFRKDIGKDLL
jgi:phosphoribosylamine--glycine ligase